MLEPVECCVVAGNVRFIRYKKCDHDVSNITYLIDMHLLDVSGLRHFYEF